MQLATCKSNSTSKEYIIDDTDLPQPPPLSKSYDSVDKTTAVSQHQSRFTSL